MVSFRNKYPEDVSQKRVHHAIDEACRLCARSKGTARLLASFVYKLREDPTWSEGEIREVIEGIHDRLPDIRGESNTPPGG